MGNKKKAVIQTILYTNLFGSSLNFDELFYFLQTDEPISKDHLKVILEELKDVVIIENGLYTLKHYDGAIHRRQQSEKSTSTKLHEARQISFWLSFIPSVLFIGVSGSVAVNNAKEDDDIDLFIISAQNSLYMTRFILLFILQLFGKRRKRNEHNPCNKFCLNMFIEEKALAFPKNAHELYTAREIVQLYPLFERDNFYQKFLQANSWTTKIMPNAKGRVSVVRKSKRRQDFFFLVEPFVRQIEQRVMARHKTTEIVEDTFLALHPNDVKKYVLQRFEKEHLRLKKYYE
ncbi:hypothetical protein BH09PAT1_BH09PAT1_5820 [soil metagenome]